MTPRQIAIELLKTQTDETTARAILSEYSDDYLEKKMAGKEQAITFVRELWESSEEARR